MSRTIKFRAWEPNDKFMHQVISFLSFNREGVCDAVEDNSDCILMQFTGLLDKNGKEIYESDYIECQGSIYEVFFMDGIFYAKDDSIQLPLYSLPIKKIIGNIYENPNLLNNN